MAGLEKVISMDHNYCIPRNKDPSEQQDPAGLDIVHKVEEYKVLLNLFENIGEARKQGMTSSMIDGVLQGTKICGFSRDIEQNCKEFVSSKQIEKHVRSIDHEANIQEFSHLPQYEEGFKNEGRSLNEEFISDGHSEKPYSIEQPDGPDEGYVISPQTVWNRVCIKTEPYNENSISPPQLVDELIKMEESEATSAEFVSSRQIVDSVSDQSENTGKTIVNWSQSLQAITKVSHDPQVGTVKMEPGLSVMIDLGIEPTYTCTICGEVFKTQAVMTLHISKFHNTKLIFICNVCGKAFTTRSSLKKHNLTHVEKCGVCGQNVIWLSLHMLNHTGERPHRCWVCQKVFIATANSNTGSSNLILTNKNGFYDCDICRKEIRGLNYFTLHMKRHTLRQTHLTCVCETTQGSPSDTKIVMTSTQEGSLDCVKTCVNLNDNDEQGKADVNNVENPCSFCDHQFQSRSELHLHLFTHFKGRFQDCNVCVHGFKSEELLLKHVSNHIESSMYDSCAYVIGVQKKQSVILDKKTWITAANYSSKQGPNHDTAEDEQPNECDVWQNGINVKRNSLEEMLTHTAEQSDKCGVRGKVFIQKDHLRAHMLTHTAQRPHKCRVCGKDFAEKCYFELHLLTHPGERPYQCSVCGKRIATERSLKMHKFTHTGERPHKCSVCGKGFIQKGHLRYHMSTHTRECRYKCSLCGKRFTQKGSFKYHMLTHTGEFPHKCSVCGKRFIEKGTLTNHMLTHTGERPYTCSVCEKGFIQKSNLKYHMMTHTGELPHKCSVCGKGFKSTNTLTNHSFTHTGVYPHHCAVCNKGFIQKSVLSKHMLTHTDKVPYKCCVCGQGFHMKTEITRHMATHTGDWSHKCGVCRKGCASKDTVRKHLSTHTTVSPYQCDICQNRFKQKHRFTKHMLIHNRDLTRKCNMCGKEFATVSTLMEHILTHAGE